MAKYNAGDGDRAKPQRFQSKKKNWGNRPMMRRASRPRTKPFIAYDLETTRIAEGTPDLLYLTAYSESYKLSVPIKGRKKERSRYLCDLLMEEFLVKRFNGFRFIAWNGNGYDVFFIALSLLLSSEVILRPYLTRANTIRGLRVLGVGKLDGLEWEFLDGMAMTGLDTVKMKLKVFVSKFAPQYPKLDLDFDSVEFDPKNPEHVAYADRDSEALYYAMKCASEIARNLTGSDLQPTMGNLAIKYFQSQMPEGVRVWKPNQELRDVLHGPAKRGGFCWIKRQYAGPIWKYDLNQAYAAAMRDAKLPCNSCVKTNKYNPDKPGVYRVTLSRETRSPIPFYYRDNETNDGFFTDGKQVDTWILSTEIDHLRADDWDVEIHEGFYWTGTFNMREMVDNLERLRFSDTDGPSGALGTMVKALGNIGYGKTLERLGGIELVMAREKPDGYHQYSQDKKELAHVFFKTDEPPPREYHAPQLGCFITAHVRIILRSAALKAPRDFIYADTDANAFKRNVDHLFKIDARRYGDWKKESNGEHYIFVGKKIYHGDAATPGDKASKHAKGLHVGKLEKADFARWFDGTIPSQRQLQRMNFVKFVCGQDMFKTQERSGTDVAKSKQARLVDGEFLPI